MNGGFHAEARRGTAKQRLTQRREDAKKELRVLPSRLCAFA
ncbi:MAG: hypothetical protein AVDCRST_MAG89-3227 [uncultured Gemmatimonadetes bacterium]|uniref:Uncharacterized protein n=1 Tax=uncultured Gemmatimonadota bacterium TaxID=203437 RepID=A0A6J4ME82_9BACT|nr:MAG: hypothetical protein AVDCRST_MAG89-3227 [uncultured Gemmatimonadota bacterium]